MQNKVILVGAGPGDVELITLKGIRALKNADVVLYDALANEELLDFAPENVPKIFVGKRAGQHSLTQSEINKLIVESAFAYGRVVRLKGGDPVVFGRAFEEMEFAQAFGIETEIISGVSSCIAVATSQQIPVTKRGLSESFWVMTGHTKAGGLPKDIHLAAQSSATIVVLMGTRNLPKLVEVFARYGKQDLPVAVIQNGTLASERCIVGKVATIQKQFVEEKMGGPAVIIFGEVVSQHPNFIENYASDLLHKNY